MGKNIKKIIKSIQNKVISLLELSLDNSLIEAVLQNNNRLLKDLIDQGDSLETPDTDGCTALHTAVKTGHYEALVLLVHAGAVLEARDSFLRTPSTFCFN